MHSEENNFAKLILPTNGIIASNCKVFLSEMTSNPKLYREYLHNLSFNGNPICFFLKKAALINPQNIYKSFKEFSSYFPSINLMLESSPKRGNGTQYFTELLKVDWYSDLIKIALFFFNEKILSQFINEMIYINKSISANEIKKILLYICNFTKSLELPTNEYEESMALETMYLWSCTIYLLSSIDGETVWSVFIEEVLSNNDVSDFHRACFYSSFSSMILSTKQGNIYSNHISNLIQLLSMKSGNHIYCIELTKLIHNLLFQNMKILKSSFSTNSNQMLFQILLSQLDFNREAFNLAAHMSNFINNTIFSTTKQYIEYYDKVNPDMRSSYLKSIVYKLYGENFATPVEINKKYVNYKWYIPDSRTSQDSIINLMLTKDDTLKDYGDELSYVVEQMIISDISYFTKVILKQLDDSQNTRTNVCTALYKGLKLFFSNIKHFKELNPIFTNASKDKKNNNEEESKDGKDYIKVLEEKARLIVFGFLAKREKKKCDVWYDTSSLATSLLSTITDVDEKLVLAEQIRTLSKTSKPIFTEEDQMSDIRTYMVQLGNSYKPVELEKNPKVDEFIEDPTISFNPDLQNVLALTVYLNPGDDIIHLLTDALLGSSPLNGSMIMRCLQALIHIKHENAALIIHHLCDYFISNQIDVIEITLIINTINLAIESAYYEKIPLSNQTMSKICFIAILGFCTPDPMVHQKIFDICQTLMHSKTSLFYLQIFFDRYEKEFSFDALRRAAQAIMPMSENDANFLLQPTFHQVSLSNYPIFYLFYLSSLGRYITMHSEGFEYSIKCLTKVLSEKLFSLENSQLDSYFTMNCLALLLSIAENMDVFKIYQIKRICLIFLRKYSSNEKEEEGSNIFLKEKEINDSIQLIALLSGITPSLFQAIMPLFSQASFSIARTFSFLAHEMINRGSFICMKNKSLSNVLYTVLHASLIFIYKRYVNSKILYMPSTPKLNTFSFVHLFLNYFAETLDAVFKSIEEANQQASKPLFVCDNTQLRTIINHPFNSKKWFIFFCNLMTCTDAMFCDNLMSAFNSWLRISQIPDKYFSSFMQRLPSLGKLYPNISTTIFRRNPSNMLSFYMIHARKHFHMFMAIANQIVVEGVPTEKSVGETITFRFGNTETIYYQNCGSLIALALFNMISKRTDRRIAGLKFLSAMVAIIGIFRNDPASTAQIFKFIETIKTTMLNSFTVFLQRDFVSLNFLLANKYKFCGEQFANECFCIVRTKQNNKINQKSLPSFPSLNHPTRSETTTKPIKLKPITQTIQKTEPANYARSTSVDYQMNFSLANINTYNSNNESISERYSVRNSWNTIVRSNLQLLSLQKQVLRYDQINVEKPQILSSLIAEWLNPISFDLQKIGISRDCKEEYRVFGIYSFVNGLLILCNAQGMTKPLADILDILIENNHELLTLCLYDLQATSPDHARSATLFLVYLYNKKPEDFINFIREYLRVTSWYFYEIQVSKVEQLLDINKIMDRNSISLTTDDTPDTQTENKSNKTSRERSLSENKMSVNDNQSQPKYEVDYLQIIKFTLNLVEECRKENAERLAEIRSLVLIFCLIHNSTFTEIADTLISNITKLKPNSQAAGSLQAFISQSKVTESWKLSDITPFIQGAEQFLLEWGLTCGDLSAASKALQIFELKRYILPSESIPTMLNAMQSVSTAMNERTDPAKKGNFNQWIIRVAGEAMRTNYEAVVSWLDQCLILLRRHAISTIQVQVVQPYSTRSSMRRNASFNRKSSKMSSVFKLAMSKEAPDDKLPPKSEFSQKKLKPRNSTFHTQKFLLKNNDFKENESILIKTFWTAVSFLQCHSLEYSSLFISALKIVDLFMSKSQLINLLKEEKTCRIKGGLIPLLLGAKASDVYSINSIFTIISCILENDLVNLLSPKKSAACIAIITLLPWIWLRFNRQDVNSEYCSTLTKLISDHFDDEKKLAEFKDSLEQIGYYQSATPTAVINAFKPLYKMVEVDDLCLILSFFIQVAKIGTVSQKECIFILCDSIYDQFDHDVPKILSEVISLITYYAVTDTSTQNSPYVLKFLKNLVQHNDRVTTPPNAPTGRTFTHFPEMEIALYYYDDYEYVEYNENEINDHDFHLKYNKSKLSEWEPKSNDVFADYSLYPPLLITDPGFNGSDFLKGIKKAIDKIVTVPFNEWYDQLFKAQLQNVTTSIQIKSERLASVEVQASEFIANFTEDMESDNKTRSRRLTPDKRRWQAIFEDISSLENEESVDFSVVPDQFFISQAHIDSLVH